MLALWPWLARGILLLLAGTAAVTDLRWRIIPNWLTLPALAAGFGIAAIHGGGHGVLYALIGAGIPAAVFGVPWILGGTGGGDLKMAIAIGVLGGPLFASGAIIWSLIWGAVLFAWRMALHGKDGATSLAPFGLALSGGVLAALAASVWGGDGARAALALAVAGVIGAAGYAALRLARHRPPRPPLPIDQPAGSHLPPLLGGDRIGADRIGADRGQALLLALLLIIGAMLVMVVGGIGVAEDVVYHSALQTAADAAAMAAAQTATPTETATVEYQVQRCKSARHWAGRAWVTQTTCTDSPTENTSVSGSIAGLSAPTQGPDGGSIPSWAAAAGCDAMSPPARTSAIICTAMAPSSQPQWTFPNPGEAEDAAIAALQQQEPQAVLTSFQASEDGSGRVYLSATLREQQNPATPLFGPIVTQVQSVGVPTLQGGG